MKYFLIWIIFLGTNIFGEQQARSVSWGEFVVLQAQQFLLESRQRRELFNFLIAKHNYQSYLEIGVGDGQHFRSIIVAHKCGVDPSPQCSCDYRMTSNEFFRQNRQTFDLIFIDGLHWREQVLQDVENSLKCLNPNGTIVLHDCLPQQIEHQYRYPVIEDWYGDVWKAAAHIRMHFQNVRMCVLDMDCGCGILTPATPSMSNVTSLKLRDPLDWNDYVQNRNELLNVMTVEDWLGILLVPNPQGM